MAFWEIQVENFSFWKNLFLTAIFFTVTPITLGLSLFSLISLNNLPQEKIESVSGTRVYASLPGSLPSVDGTVEGSDARAEIIKQYLTLYRSPLEPYADLITQASDKYNLDFRLVAAIAQQESNLCKIIPPGSYNCWGWGIHSEGTLGFRSYADGIETVSKGLREEYLDKGYETIEDIMSKYTPLSSGSWASGVSQFMAEME